MNNKNKIQIKKEYDNLCRILLYGNICLEVRRVAVKHIPTRIIHSGSKGGTTGCGFDTKENTVHWVNTSSKITCDKNGCRN